MLRSSPCGFTASTVLTSTRACMQIGILACPIWVGTHASSLSALGTSVPPDNSFTVSYVFRTSVPLQSSSKPTLCLFTVSR